MAKTLQHRRDTTANLASVTGSAGEIFIDTTKKTVVVMDGSTAGGFPLALEGAGGAGATGAQGVQGATGAQGVQGASGVGGGGAAIFNQCGTNNITSCISGNGGSGNDNFLVGACAGNSMAQYGAFNAFIGY